MISCDKSQGLGINMFYMRYFRILFVINITIFSLMIAISPSIALADAATHNMSIKTKEYKNVDCGGGTCTNECLVESKLSITKFGPETSAPIGVQIWYKTDHVDAGEAAISLAFDKLSKGKVVTAQGQAPGYRCSEVVAKRILVECFQNADGKCPGFYYVQIPHVPALKIKAQKIEGK